MKSEILDLIAAVIAGLSIGAIVGVGVANKFSGVSWEREAIGHGAASYVIIDDGESLEFKWNDELTDRKGE